MKVYLYILHRFHIFTFPANIQENGTVPLDSSLKMQFTPYHHHGFIGPDKQKF